MTTKNIAELTPEYCNHLGRLGKSAGEEALSLFWTGSGIEIAVKGSELKLEVEAGYDVFELWLDIIVDGALIQRRMLERGTQTITVFRGMDPETVKQVKIIRDTQAMPKDKMSFIDLKKLVYDGNLVKIKKHKYSLEVIGDSITSGEGMIGHRELEDWIPYCFSAEGTYWNLTAENLDAAVSVLSQSGWGVYCSYEGNPKEVLPLYYDRICGMLEGESEQQRGSRKMYSEKDPYQKAVDAVVINLGTNDGNGLLTYGSKKEFQISVYHFLERIREIHPNAQIVWMYGMLGNSLKDEIKGAVEDFNTAEGRGMVHYLAADNTTWIELGARQHPGPRAHEKVAKKLSSFLVNIISQ